MQCGGGVNGVLKPNCKGGGGSGVERTGSGARRPTLS